MASSLTASHPPVAQKHNTVASTTTTATTYPPPAVQNITFLGTTIVANWVPAQGSGMYFALTLFKNGTSVQSVPAYGVSGTLPNVSVDTQSVYTVAVAQADQSGNPLGPYSNAIPVIVAAPTNVTIAYDGTAFVIQWQVPAGQTVATGGRVTLYDQSGTSIESRSYTGTQATYQPAIPLNPQKKYTIAVAGESAGSLGNYCPKINVIQNAPTLAQLTYTLAPSGSTAQLTANAAAPDPTYPTLGVYLYQGSTLMQSGSGIGIVAAMSLASPLDPGSEYWVYIARLDNGSRGPLSNRMAVIVEPATVNRVSYDGQTVSAQWTFFPGTVQAQPTGASIGVYNAAGTAVAGASVLGTSGGVVPNPVLTPNAAYTLKMSPQRGGSAGPVSAPINVITTVQTITSVTYDGARILIGWDTATGPGMQSTQMYLQSNGYAVRSATAGGTSGMMDMVLDPNGVYDVVLQAMGWNSSGPLGTSVPVVAVAPRITGVVYVSGTTNKVTVNWNAATIGGLHGITGYIAQLYENGAPSGNPVVVNGATIATVDIPLTAALAPWKTYSVTIQATGTKSKGPLSTQVAVIAGGPVLNSVAFDGTNASVAWSGVVPGATGYDVQIIDNTGAVAAGPTSTSGSQLKLALTPAAGKTYQAQVRAFGAATQGMWSAGTPVLVEALVVNKANYSPTFVDVAWTAATATAVTGYEVHLYQDGALLVAEPVAGAAKLEARIYQPLNASGACSATVLPTAGISRGRESAAVGLISATPQILGVVYTTIGSNKVTVTWNASVMQQANGVTGYLVQFYENGVASGNPVTVANPATGSADIPLASALSGWKTYTATVQATGTNAIGPVSAPASVIGATPTVSAISYDGTNATIGWSAAGGESVTGYSVQIIDNTGAIVAGPVSTNALQAVLALAPTAGKTYQAQVRAFGGVTQGMWSAGSAIAVESLALTKANYASGSINVAWGAATEGAVNGYQVRLYQNNALIVSESVTGAATTSARIAQVLDGAGAYSVTVSPVAGLAVGKASAAIAVVSAIPQVLTVQYATGANAQVTVTWNASALQQANGVTGYSVQLYENGVAKGNPVIVSSAATGTADIPVATALSAWKSYTVTVQATGTNATGPMSPAAGVIVTAPSVVKATINGAQWSASWQAASESWVTGYEITVTDSAGANPVTFNSTVPQFSAPNQFTQNQCLASVCAIGAIARGPQGTATNLYGAGSSYYFSATGAANPGYLFMAASRPATASNITLYLPDLFTQTPSISSSVFQLTKPATSAQFPYLITIPSSSVAWQFDATSRATLWQAYVQFLKDLDVVVGGQPLLQPGAFNVIAQVLGRSLPLLFSEQLSYVYRFNAPSGYVDLVPGMRVRLDTEARQYVGPPNASNANLSGFVSNGTMFMDVGEYWQTTTLNAGFNSYLSLAGRPNVPSSDSTGGAAGGIDLYAPLNRCRLYRLLYPQTIPTTNSFGNADMTGDMLIIGANRFADLDGATQQYVQNGNFSGYEQTVNVTHFRGRAVITPEIPIFINNTLQYVAVGTTARQALGLVGGGAYPAGRYITNLNFQRAANNIVTNITNLSTVANAVSSTAVRFDDAPMANYTGGVDYLDLPLIQGDALTLNGSAN